MKKIAPRPSAAEKHRGDMLQAIGLVSDSVRRHHEALGDVEHERLQGLLNGLRERVPQAGVGIACANDNYGEYATPLTKASLLLELVDFQDAVCAARDPMERDVPPNVIATINADVYAAAQAMNGHGGLQCV